MKKGLIHPGLGNSFGTEIKSISVSRELADLAREYKISWSEAARRGMAMILADIGVKEYDNNLNLYRKMNYFREELEKLMIKIDEKSKCAEN